MALVAWIVLGLIAGSLAKLIYPGAQGGGIFSTILLGIVGAVAGGYVGEKFFGMGASATDGVVSVQSVVVAILGSVLLIFLWNLATQGRRR